MARVGVPRFSTSASARRAISAASSGDSAIMGLAPRARARFAQSLAVTVLEMQCSRGRFFLMSSRRASSGIYFSSRLLCIIFSAPPARSAKTSTPAMMEPTTVEMRKGMM